MDGTSIFSVITTIHPPNECVRHLDRELKSVGGQCIVVGDRKGPHEYALDNVDFYPLDRQASMELGLASALPENHYTRKNLGYLAAISAGAKCIYETDDDTMPSKGWQIRSASVDAQVADVRPWMNVLRNYHDGKIWPRGFPLDQINNESTWQHDPQRELQRAYAPIQQGMIDRSPDVDAIWRLVYGHEVYFDSAPSISLPPGTWCPFNSQNTWWWPAAFPLMYLPSHCEFRATDIWRGFIAQRCLWELGCGVVFHGPDSIQHRNVHNIMSDFADEVRGYLENNQITTWLTELRLQSGLAAVSDNLLCCYEMLISHGVFPAEEWSLVSRWVADVEACCQRARGKTESELFVPIDKKFAA